MQETDATTLRLKTSRFGEIEIDQTRSLHFPEGILGFPEQKEYVILEHKPGSPFCWLQSVESPDLAFVMVDPLLVKSDFLEGLSPSDRRLFETEDGVRKAVFALVTIPPGRVDRMTVNLLGPVLIDLKTRTARQVILANSGYSHRHPFFPS
jgi:flagellar assembly factor FliW